MSSGGASSADGAGAQAPDGASNELAASLTDRLIQFWRTGEMGDGEFLPDEFYGAPGDKGAPGAGGFHPNDDASADGASVLDFLPRRGPLPELRNAKQRQAPPAGSDDAFAAPGFGMFGPSADPFAASPVPSEEGHSVLKQSSNAGHGPDAEFTDHDGGLWGRSESIAHRDDDGAFGGMKNSDRILGLDGSRTRDGETQSPDAGRRSAPTMRRDSLWGGDQHDPLPSHDPKDTRRESLGGGHNAFERIAPDNQFGSGDQHFGEGFEMYREPAPILDRSQTERPVSDRHWDDPKSQTQAQPQSRRGPLPRQNAPVVTQEERPPVKRKPVLEVTFIYGSALALAAAVMGAIYLSNEGRMNKLGQAGQQAGMSGMNGMNGMNGMAGMNGMNGMAGMYGPNGMAGGNAMAGNMGPNAYGLPQRGPAGAQGPQRAFEVHDVVGFPSRPIALSIVLPKPLGETDAFLSIGGLPDGAQLSAGTRMASGFWMLRFDDIEGLTLKLPDSAPAEIQAEAAILRQDGAKSFERNFRISTANQGRASAPEASSQPERAPAPTTIDLPKMAPDAEKALLGRANVLLEQGDISAARLMLEHGAVKGCVECGFKLAQICDPLYLSKLDVWGVQPDIEKALRWYAWSARYGHPKASEAHGKLKQKILSDIPGN